MINKITKEVDDLNLVAMVFEVNMIDSNLKVRWIDIGATKHIYSNKPTSLPLNQFKGKIFTWVILPLLLYWDKEKWC